jgi:hypothetical protein
MPEPKEEKVASGDPAVAAEDGNEEEVRQPNARLLRSKTKTY